MPGLQPTLQIRAKRNLADRDILEILLYCDSGSCLNLVSKKKARKDGVKIIQGPHPYKARDVQGKPLEIIGYAEYYLLNDNNYVRKQTENYGYVDKGVPKQNKNNNKPAPRVAKATDTAPKEKKEKKEKKKRFDPPCNYCVSIGYPEPKRSN